MDTFLTQWRILGFNMARTRRKFSKEFKFELAKLVLASGKSVAEVAKSHEISDSVVSTWVRQARIDAGQGPESALTSEERAELAALRKECRELRMERDFLKKCSTWFARQTG